MILSDSQVLRNLGGLTVYLDQVADSLSLVDESIQAAEAEFQRQTRVLLETKTIRMNPPEEMVAGEDYDLLDDPHPYRHAGRQQFFRVQSKWRPIQEILSFRLEFDHNNRLVSIPIEWVRLNKRLGEVSVIPWQTAAAFAATAGAAVGVTILGNLAWPGDTVPALIAFDYTAGYTDAATAPDKADIRTHLAQQAAKLTAQGIDRLIPTSVGMDGFSQQYTAMEQKFDRWDKEYAQWLKTFMRTERGVIGGVL